MPTLWIHAGARKTGTTSLQVFLKDNEQLLLDKHNIYIPKTCRRPRKHQIRHDGDFLWNIEHRAMLDEFIKELQAHPGHDYIISDEHICFGGPSLLVEHIDEIKRKCPDVTLKIIVYLRRIDDLAKSIYNHRVKYYVRKKIEDLPYDYNTFVRDLANRKLSIFGYARVLAQYQEVLGVKNVVLRLFNRQFLYNNDTVSDFFHLLGIDTSNGFVHKTDSNVSPPMKIIPFFMGQGLPDDMPKNARERLMQLATDTFSIQNTVKDECVITAIHEEIGKLNAVYSAYADSQGHGADAKGYMDLYKGREIDINTNDLECDRYTLLTIRQLNYLYHEALLQGKNMKQLQDANARAYKEIMLLKQNIEQLKKYQIGYWCVQAVKKALRCIKTVKGMAEQRLQDKREG